jgi:hypothetical protein
MLEKQDDLAEMSVVEVIMIAYTDNAEECQHLNNIFSFIVDANFYILYTNLTSFISIITMTIMRYLKYFQNRINRMLLNKNNKTQAFYNVISKSMKVKIRRKEIL